MNDKNRASNYVRTIYRTQDFLDFYNALHPNIQMKFLYVMDVIATVYNVSTKFIKRLETCDLYEMRVSVGSNEYRTVLFAIDHQNFIEAKEVILLNGFLKKDNRDYRRQIEIAKSILNNLSHEED